MEEVKEGQDNSRKLSYEELKSAAVQWKNEAEQWRKKAYEEAGKISRISLILECLKLQCGFAEFNITLFFPIDIDTMKTELYTILYPPQANEDNKEADVVPLVPVE